MDTPHAANDHLTDAHEHQRTYSHFVWAAKWIMVLHAAGGLFLVLLFATGTGLLGSLIAALLVFAGGLWWLRMGWRRDHRHPLHS